VFLKNQFLKFLTGCGRCFAASQTVTRPDRRLHPYPEKERKGKKERQRPIRTAYRSKRNTPKDGWRIYLTCGILEG
jgi:hypothetical protein